MKENILNPCCVYVIKDCDINNSYFEKNITLCNNINIHNTIIKDGYLNKSERSTTNYCNISEQQEKSINFKILEKQTYDYCIESIRLSEITNICYGEVDCTTLYLKGNSLKENIFTFNYNDIYGSKKNLQDIMKIVINVPRGSSIVINIIGNKVIFNCIEICVNGKVLKGKEKVKLLWNFPETSFFSCTHSNLYGAFLLPFSSVRLKNCKLYGILVARYLKGDCKIYYNNCIGEFSHICCEVEQVHCHTHCTDVPTTTCTTPMPTTTCTTPLPTTTCTTYNCTTSSCCSPFEQAYVDVIESIALEEAGLSHIINAEGEKIQKSLEFAQTTEDLLKINNSVKRTLATVNHSQMLLQFKLEEVQRQIKKC